MIPARWINFILLILLSFDRNWSTLLIDPISLGHPGTLPVLNKKQVEYIMESLDKLYNRLMNDTNWFKPSDDFKLDGSE